MKASTLIKLLENSIMAHGDLEVIGGTLSDDTPLRSVTIISSDGCEVFDNSEKAIGIFLEA